MRYRRGFAWNQSTARGLWTQKVASGAAAILPHYAQEVWAAQYDDPWLFGWRLLTWTSGSGVYAVSHFEWTPSAKHWDAVSPAVSLGKCVRWPVTLSSWEFGYERLQKSPRATPSAEGDHGLRWSLRGVGEKVQLTAWTPLASGVGWGIAAGLSDLKGLGHWLIRLGQWSWTLPQVADRYHGIVGATVWPVLAGDRQRTVEWCSRARRMMKSPSASDPHWRRNKRSLHGRPSYASIR